ncbi:MAG: CDP-diacylglycerol--serine O-phosphatidyltransferase [Candidatus Zixiibacteriota bacterium]
MTPKRNFRGFFPGMFTMGNLFCGFLSILASMDGEVEHACRFILLGFFLDGLDGFVARVSRGATRFGVELDSLADLVTFGMAPAILIYSFKLKVLGRWGWVLGFIFVMCGAFRLARYNLTTKTSPRRGFEGLPIPAAASLLVAYTLFSYDLWEQLLYVKFLVVTMIVTSGLMVSTIAYEDKPTSWRTPKDRVKFIFIFLGIIAVMIDLPKTFFPLVLIYVLHGIGRAAVELVSGNNGHHERGHRDSDATVSDGI